MSKYYVVRDAEGNVVRTGVLRMVDPSTMSPRHFWEKELERSSLDGSVWVERSYFKVEPPLVLGEGQELSFQ